MTFWEWFHILSGSACIGIANACVVNQRYGLAVFNIFFAIVNFWMGWNVHKGKA